MIEEVASAKWQDNDGHWYVLFKRKSADGTEIVAIPVHDEMSAQRFLEGFSRLMADHSAMPLISGPLIT